jgi:hypothetical protein
MKKIALVLMGLAVGVLMLSAACGGGGGKEKPTATAPEATATEAGTPSGTPETPPSAAELAADLTDIKAVLQDTLAKAQAGDVQGTRDAEAKGDKSMEAIIKAVRLVDPALADQIEALELDYEKQADSTTTDLTVIAKDAQDALALLDQAGTTLGISP